jgi:hypothetical protein
VGVEAESAAFRSRAPQRLSGNASSQRTGFAETLVASAGGPHFGAQSKRAGAKVEKVIADACGRALSGSNRDIEPTPTNDRVWTRHTRRDGNTLRLDSERYRLDVLSTHQRCPWLRPFLENTLFRRQAE